MLNAKTKATLRNFVGKSIIKQQNADQDKTNENCHTKNTSKKELEYMRENRGFWDKTIGWKILRKNCDKKFSVGYTVRPLF